MVQDMPSIAEFRSRWPALFMEDETSFEFAGHKYVVFASCHNFNISANWAKIFWQLILVLIA